MIGIHIKWALIYKILKVIEEPLMKSSMSGSYKYIFLTTKGDKKYILKVGVITKCHLAKLNIREELEIIKCMQGMTPKVCDYWECTIDELTLGFLVMDKWDMRLSDYMRQYPDKREHLLEMIHNMIKRIHILSR